MYSVLPAGVSILFLSYGFYALSSRGLNRISGSFFLLCVTTFFWQATWAVLYQANTPDIAIFLVKFGYFFILFLPTSMYHFLAEISSSHAERRYVYASYIFSALLTVALIFTNWFVSGYYEYFWGCYPKAGILHPLHLLQTFIIVLRGIHITYTAQKHAPNKTIQLRLRFCIAGLLTFLFAAIDYLCNYGIEFYPPGIVFIAIALGFLTIAIVKYDLLNPMSLAATFAHEMRTPLATIRNQASGIAIYLPVLLEGYMRAVENKLVPPSIPHRHLLYLSGVSKKIMTEIDKSNAVIDIMLASSALETPENIQLDRHMVSASITEALERYPFEADMRERINVSIGNDFEFYGSDTLLVAVLFNLLNNSIHALNTAGKGEIHIETTTAGNCNILSFTDTGPGIPKEILPNIFTSYYSTKHKAGGMGIGLAFCKKVMAVFQGSISCHSAEAEYTTFTLEFPIPAPVSQPSC